LPPILILEETGTGKGLLARAIHRASSRASGPFVPVNCAAIPETLLESELFGFERGAFTDARHAKAGLFQSANGGTLFLDEIGAMPVSLQAKLLTALEERTIRRLGSTRSEPLDVWILAATTEDLPAATRERRFREDLYHRLSAMTVVLPPLRKRGADVALLAEHFLRRLCAEYGLAPKRLSPDARIVLQAYGWPGNVRELSNVMERVALLVASPSITAMDLGIGTRVSTSETGALAQRETDRPLRESVGDFERSQLTAALESVGGNLSRAAALLGIPRNTLRYRLEKHGLRSDARVAASVPVQDRKRSQTRARRLWVYVGDRHPTQHLAGEHHAVAVEDVDLAVERDVIGVLRRDHLGEQSAPRRTAPPPRSRSAAGVEPR
jgi:DNA-binding NtrC family response regulator